MYYIRLKIYSLLTIKAKLFHHLTYNLFEYHDANILVPPILNCPINWVKQLLMIPCSRILDNNKGVAIKATSIYDCDIAFTTTPFIMLTMAITALHHPKIHSAILNNH